MTGWTRSTVFHVRPDDERPAWGRSARGIAAAVAAGPATILAVAELALNAGFELPVPLIHGYLVLPAVFSVAALMLPVVVVGSVLIALGSRAQRVRRELWPAGAIVTLWTVSCVSLVLSTGLVACTG